METNGGVETNKGGRSTIAMVVLVLLAGGAGVAAFNMRTEAQGARARLDRTLADHRAASEALDQAKKAKDATQGKLAECTSSLDAEKATREQTEKLSSDTAANLNATRAELDELRKEHADDDKQLAAVKAISEKLRKMIDAGKIQVAVRARRMIVKLPAEVLFASGSADLSKDGQAPLAEVAGALKQFADRKFMVAGHTDNVPVGDKRFKDNWELSSARAVTVLEFLVSKGMPPSRLAAAGYGEFEPTHSNQSQVGRAENRRIEIVLLPNTAELPKLPPAAAKAK
jgi:chemotaxis protein MotB